MSHKIKPVMLKWSDSCKRELQMGWFIYLVSALLIFSGGALVGMIWTENSYKKHSSFMVRYMGLTSKSKRLVDGYVSAREVNDERTTYRERK